MNKVARYLSGIMIISLFWLYVGSNAFSRSDTKAVEHTPIQPTADEKSVEDKAAEAYIPVSSIMYCAKIRNNEKNLVKEGMRILSTGLTMSSNTLGEELIEVWMEPKSNSESTARFAVVRIIPKLDMSCILTTGPRMVPGGAYTKEEDN